MQFIKTRQVKDPIRDVTQNAGIDFYIPDNTPEFIEGLKAKNPKMLFITQEEYSAWSSGGFAGIAGYTSMFNTTTGEITIFNQSDVIIPSGIKSKFGPELALIANNKSGIATKKKLIFGASVIDASYQGEWHFHLINTSTTWQTVDCGTKVIQFIPHLISTDPVEIVDMTAEEFYKDSTSTRGEGWQGSTGLK